MYVHRLSLRALACWGIVGLLGWPAAADEPAPTDAERPQLIQRLIDGTRAAETAEAADNLAVAGTLRRKMLELHIRLQGEKHWQTTDARLALAHVERLAKLTPAQRKDLAEAGRLNGLVLTLYAQGKSSEALPHAQRALELRRQLLGEEHILTAQSSNNLAAHCNVLGKVAEADSLHRQALAIRKKLLGLEHPEVAVSCHNLADTLRGRGKRGEAEGLDRQALAIRRKALGEENADTAFSYNTLAVCLYFQGKYQESELLHRQALAIRRKTLGAQHADTAQSYNNLALDLHALGKYDQSEPLYRQALAIWRKTTGEGSADTAVACANLALTLTARAKHAEAETFHRQALAIRRKVLGEHHAETARSYDGLGACLDAQGKHAEAGEFLRTGLAIRELVLDPQHPDLGESYNNIGQNLQIGLGKHAEAEGFLHKALGIWQKVRGEDHFYTAVAYHNLACCLDAQGKRAEAGPLHQRALAIVRKVRGEKHLDTAIIDTAVAKHLYLRGQYREAGPLFHRVLEIRRQQLGEEHPDTIQGSNNLAANLMAQDQYAEATQLLHRAAAICRKNWSADHPIATYLHQNLAVALDRQGGYREADVWHRQALIARVKVFGPEHPETIQVYANLALNLRAQGNYAEAEKLASLAATSFQAARLRISFAGLDRAAFAAEMSPLPLLAGLLARRGQASRAQQCLEENLGRGLLDDLNGYQRLSGPDRNRLGELAAGLQRLDKRLTANASPSQEAEGLRRERDAAQETLSAFQAELAGRYGVAAGHVYDLGRIQARLPAATALIAWLDLKGYAQAADPGGDHWVCLVRRNGPPAWVKMTGSGPDGAWTGDDDSLPDRVREAFLKRRPDWRSLTEKLAAQRLAPIAPYLQEAPGQLPVAHLVVLPSPAMAGLPVETLTDRYRISYAPSGTMFAWLQEQREKAKRPHEAPSLLALGDPVFPPRRPPPAGTLEGDRLDQALRGPSFRSLPGSRREVEAIAALFARTGGRVEKLLGADASEQRLDQLARAKELEKFRYLHLATHGVADPQQGLCSYLALAQDRPAPALSPPSADQKYYDGKLTAAQVMHSWQLNADLVTLGACETGLGQRQQGEGYLGFAQALFLAGSRSLVLSLWQVDDRATSLLMVRFYQNLLGKRPGLNGGMPKAAALAEAKQWLRALARDDADRHERALSRGPLEPAPSVAAPTEPESRPFEHPHFWAGFILIGDPGAVSQTVPIVAAAAATVVDHRETPPTRWPWWAGGVMALGALAIVVCYRRRRLLR